VCVCVLVRALDFSPTTTEDIISQALALVNKIVSPDPQGRVPETVHMLTLFLRLNNPYQSSNTCFWKIYTTL